MDGVRAMYRAAIQRAMHDACGATVVAPTQVQQMKFAKQAWNFLYSQDKEFSDERWLVCSLAGIETEALEARMAVAAIPLPTYDTLRNAWTQLELAYWRLSGQKGPKPDARPENAKPMTRSEGNARVANGRRVAPVRDRRNAGQPLIPKRGGTLLFGDRRGTPARPKFAGAAGLWAQGRSGQGSFGF